MTPRHIDHGSHTIADAEWAEHQAAMDDYDPTEGVPSLADCGDW